MTMSWATRRVRACTKIYATRMSTFSTMSMNPIVGIQDFYSVDSRGSLRKGD
jgi:hypothetical protein